MDGAESQGEEKIIYDPALVFKGPDNDGLTDLEEIETYPTDPLNPDSDKDGLSDFDELLTHFTNPLEVDSDKDGYTDSFELGEGLSPIDPDSIPVTTLFVHTPLPVNIAVELEIFTKIDKTHQIQVSEDLENWEDAGNPVLGTGEAVRELFQLTGGASRLYWRVREED